MACSTRHSKNMGNAGKTVTLQISQPLSSLMYKLSFSLYFFFRFLFWQVHPFENTDGVRYSQAGSSWEINLYVLCIFWYNLYVSLIKIVNMLTGIYNMGHSVMFILVTSHLHPRGLRDNVWLDFCDFLQDFPHLVFSRFSSCMQLKIACVCKCVGVR